MAEKNAYIKLFTDCLEAWEALGDAERGRLVTALLEYQRSGTVVKLTGNERFVFPVYKAQIDRDNKSYDTQRTANKENGKKGAAKRWENGNNDRHSEIASDSENSDRHFKIATDGENSQEKEEEKEKDKDKENNNKKSKISLENFEEISPAELREKNDYQAVVDDYNRTCTRLSRCIKLSDARKKAISARLKKYSTKELHTVFVKAQGSDFLCGQNSKNWSASFDWLLNDANIVKVLEGKYDNRKKGRNETTSDKESSIWDSGTV